MRGGFAAAVTPGGVALAVTRAVPTGRSGGREMTVLGVVESRAIVEYSICASVVSSESGVVLRMLMAAVR